MATIMHRRADEPTTGRSGHLLALGTPTASRLVADVRARAAPVNGLKQLGAMRRLGAVAEIASHGGTDGECERLVVGRAAESSRSGGPDPL